MPSERNSRIAQVPTAEFAEHRFAFITNEVLRKNCALSYQYTIFLIAVLADQGATDSTVASSAYKDMIVQTAAIVESCLLHCLREMVKAGAIRVEDVMPNEWLFRNEKVLHQISDDERVSGVIMFKKIEELDARTKFISVNRACRKAGILDEDLFKRAQEIRENRNNIHLLGLRSVDDKYEKKDVDAVFSSTTRIMDAIEKKLSEIVAPVAPAT